MPGFNLRCNDVTFYFQGLSIKKQRGVPARTHSFVVPHGFRFKRLLTTTPAMVSPKMEGIYEMLPRITRRCSQLNFCSDRLGQMQSMPHAFDEAGSSSRCSSVE